MAKPKRNHYSSSCRTIYNSGDTSVFDKWCKKYLFFGIMSVIVGILLLGGGVSLIIVATSAARW